MASPEEPLSESATEYTEAENRQLAAQLTEITREIHLGALLDSPPTVRLLQDFHARLFHSVRDHAGKIRQQSFGTEYLTFGPNRSARNADVPESLARVFVHLPRRIALFDESREALNYEIEALKLAATTHADVVRIHPFQDGNGRTSRLLMNWILVRLGLRPIAIEAVKKEYNQCLNLFFDQGQSQPLLDLLLQLYEIPQ